MRVTVKSCKIINEIFKYFGIEITKLDQHKKFKNFSSYIIEWCNKNHLSHSISKSTSFGFFILISLNIRSFYSNWYFWLFDTNNNAANNLLLLIFSVIINGNVFSNFKKSTSPSIEFMIFSKITYNCLIVIGSFPLFA